MTAEWLTKQMGLKNAKYLNSQGDHIWFLMGLAFQAVGDGLCKTALVVYPTGNLPGRYHHTGENVDSYASAAAQWTNSSFCAGKELRHDRRGKVSRRSCLSCEMPLRARLCSSQCTAR